MYGQAGGGGRPVTPPGPGPLPGACAESFDALFPSRVPADVQVERTRPVGVPLGQREEHPAPGAGRGRGSSQGVAGRGLGSSVTSSL